MGLSLSEWIEEHGEGAKTRLSRAVGCRWQTMHEIASGRSRPRPHTAVAIEFATGGEVRAEDLLGLDAMRDELGAA